MFDHLNGSMLAIVELSNENKRNTESGFVSNEFVYELRSVR